MNQPPQATDNDTSRDVTSTPAASGQSKIDQTQYDLLVRQYGDAMQRIGQLETELNHLRKLPQGTTPGEPAEARDGVSSELTGDSTELDAGSSTGSGPRVNVGIGNTDGRSNHSSLEGSTEISQLRVQLVSLAGQLARTEGELGQLKGTGTPHRRRSRSRHNNTPKWKFWARKSRG